MTVTELYLVAMLVILTLPFAVWRLARTDAWAPLVVVQIIAGILLGPGVMGAVFPEIYATIFTPQVIGALNGIAWWAVMMFVFVAGVELDLGAAWSHRRDTLTTAGLALAAPLALGSLAAAALLTGPEWLTPKAATWQGVLGIGMACAVTALPILVLFLERLAVLRTPFGQRVLRYASLDDIAIWGVLALILLDWQRVERQVTFLVVFALAAFAARRLFPRVQERDRWPLALIWLAACGLGADWSGLHFMVGAFIAGAVLDKAWFGEARLDAFRDTILLTVMPVFFLSTGLRTGWQAGGGPVIAAAALLLAASIAGKLAGVWLAGRLNGWPKGDAWTIGWLLQTKALIMIIFANILLDRGIITSGAFTALLLMAVGSTMLTMPVVRGRLAGVGASGRD